MTIRRPSPQPAFGLRHHPDLGGVACHGVHHLPAVGSHHAIRAGARPANDRIPKATVRRQSRLPLGRRQAAERHRHESPRRFVHRLRPRAVRRGARVDGGDAEDAPLRRGPARLSRDRATAARRRNRRCAPANARPPRRRHDRIRANWRHRAAVRSLRLRVAPGHRAPGRRGGHAADVAGLRRCARRLRRGAGRLHAVRRRLHHRGCRVGIARCDHCGRRVPFVRCGQADRIAPWGGVRRRSQTPVVRSYAAVRPAGPGSLAVEPGEIPPAGALPDGQIRASAADRGSRRDRPSRARCGARPPSGHRPAGPAAASQGAAGSAAGRRLGSARRRASRRGRPRDLFLPTCAVRRRALG